MLATRPLVAFEWLIVISMSILVISVIESVKWWFLRKNVATVGLK